MKGKLLELDGKGKGLMTIKQDMVQDKNPPLTSFDEVRNLAEQVCEMVILRVERWGYCGEGLIRMCDISRVSIINRRVWCKFDCPL